MALDHPTKRPATCPACGQPAGVPIVRGLPAAEAIEAERRGEVVIGGCEVEEGQPDYRCRECGWRWAS